MARSGSGAVGAVAAVLAACSLTQGADGYRSGARDAGAPDACAPGSAACATPPPEDAGAEEDAAPLPAEAGPEAACARDCGGGACVAGVCQPVALATNQAGPGQIVIDLDYVYWTNYGSAAGGGGVARVRNDGQNLAVVAGGQPNAWGVAVEDTGADLFWSTAAAGTNVVGRANKVGSQATAPATVTAVAGRVRGVALDPGSKHLYFALYDGASQGIYRVDRSAASAAPELVVATPKPNAVAVDDANVYFVSEGASGATGAVGVVARSSALPATAAFLGVSLNRPRGLALDATHVYWTNAGSTAAGARDASVERNAKGGAPAGKVTLARDLADVRELAVDATHVYFTSYKDETVARVPKGGDTPATPEILAQNGAGGAKVVASPLAIAVDARYVYWSNYGGGAPGAILRLMKP